ncbi:hypothetical protein GF378_00880 [Candidatus Pacearchaeota archaeon]|nr:hypothetical protein [Candidatus Pacearchaeota archaeon]
MSRFYSSTELMKDIRGLSLEQRTEIFEKFLESGRGARRKRFREIYSHLKRGLKRHNSSAMPGWLEMNQITIPEPSLSYPVLHQIASYAATGEVRNPKQDKRKREKRYNSKNTNIYGSAADTFQRRTGSSTLRGPGHHY